MKPISKYVIAFFFLVAFVGFLDASYLTFHHYAGIIPPCFVTDGCDVVTTSAYSKVMGIPVALFGALYYLAMLVLMLYYIDKEDARALKAISLVSLLGFLSSIWLVYAQVFLIRSLCTYCLLSAMTSTFLFLFGIYFWRATRTNSQISTTT